MTEPKSAAHGTGANGTVPNPNASLQGVPAGIGKVPRSKRPSQLSKSALSLPAVESSLEEFIAKANQTLVDVNTWDKAEKDAKQEDAKRKEGDAQRWKATEQQMRDAEVREMALRRQLDGLQGKLAEAEARAAVAADAAGNTSQLDASMASLRLQVQQAEAKIQDAELRATEMQRELVVVRSSSPTLPADDAVADERVRQAEAKASKAIAAARAAAAGLTINATDLAALENGLPVEAPLQRQTPWLLVGVAFLGGLAIMFVVYKLALAKPDTAPMALAAPAQPIVTPIAPTPPTITPITPITPTTPTRPIEEPKTAAVVAPAPVPAAAPVADPAPAPASVEPKVTPAAVVETPKAIVQTPKAKLETPTTKPTTKASGKPDLADPFAEPKKAPPAKKKPAIVDPFAN